MPQPKRSRSYSFTLNNYNETHIACLTNEHMRSRYIVYGKEVGATGTPHLQGLIYFDSLRSMKQVHERCGGLSLSKTLHMKQSIAYCMKGIQSHEEWDQLGVLGPNYGKDADIFEDGDRPTQGKRTDLHDVADAIEEGTKIRDIAAAFPTTYIKYHAGIERLAKRLRTDPPDLSECNNEWFYGPSRTGKSTTARAENPGCYVKMLSKWWCNYEDQDVVLIEEVSPSEASMASLLKTWADKFAFPVEVKGSSMVIRPKKIIVTSNYTIAECFPHENDYPALENRFKVRKFPE